MKSENYWFFVFLSGFWLTFVIIELCVWIKTLNFTFQLLIALGVGITYAFYEYKKDKQKEKEEAKI